MLYDVNLNRRGSGFVVEGGFTLMELLIVVMIVGILGLAVVPQIQLLIQEARLNGAAGELVTALEYASEQAAAYQRPFGVKVTGNSTTFSVFDVRYRNDPTAHPTETPPVTAFGVVMNPVDKRWYTLDFQNLPHLTGTLISTAPPLGEIVFYPAGHCAALVNTLVVTYRTSSRTLTVNGMTGGVAVQ